MQHRTLARAMLIGVAALGAWTATELADDHAAHADAPPAVTVDRPGGLVDRTAKLHRLPQQASARARAAVAKTTTEPAPSTPAEPQPEPSDEPTEPAPPVEAPPVELPTLPPAETPLPPLPPVEVPPLPTPLPVELPPTPRTDPLPAPPVVDIPDPQLPVPLPVPGLLPVTIGPPPGAEPPTGGVVDQLIAELTASEPVQPLCADDPDDARHIDRDALRALLAGLDHKPTATASESNPCQPQMPAVSTTGAGQVKPPPPTAADLIVANLIGSHVPPALGRLEHARARSTIPTSRHVAIEPGPA